MAPSPALRSWTLAEFLEWEQTQEGKWEFVDGRPLMMAGGTAAANRISVNLASELRSALRGTGCEAFSENMRLIVASDAFYPDVMIICGSVGNEATSVEEPTVIFEVLSPGTERYDSGLKFLKYQSIATLKHYVMVAQGEFAVQLYSRRADGLWDYAVVRGADQAVALPALGVKIAMADLYERVL